MLLSELPLDKADLGPDGLSYDKCNKREETVARRVARRAAPTD